MKKKYDLIISIGQGCLTPHLLREMCLRKFASPFDWTFMDNYKNSITILKNRFENYFNKDDLEFFYYEKRTNTDVYTNKINHLQHIHCFPPGNATDFDTAYQNVNNMYSRRIKRFFDFINNKKNPKILLLFIERAYDEEYIEEKNEKRISPTNSQLENDIKELNKTYGKNYFDILYIKHDENLKMNEWHTDGKIIYVNNSPIYAERRCKGNYEFLKKVLKKQIGLKFFDYLLCLNKDKIKKFKLLLFIIIDLRI